MTPYFPQELYDLVLDTLCEDRKTLRSCATVCRAWSHSTRRHIFSKIELKCTPSTSYFWRNRYEAWNSGDGLVPLQVSKCQQLHALFASSPRIIPYVHELRLTLSTFDFWVHHSIDPDQLAALSKLLNTLVYLRRLEFSPATSNPSTMFWSTFPPSLLNAFANVFCLQSLDSIYLHSWFVSSGDLLSLLCQCPNLKRLSLRNISFHWSGNEDERVMPILCIPRLEVLSLEQVYFKGRGTDEWIRLVAGELRELRVKRSLYESMQEHISSLGGDLEALELDLGTESHSLDLSSNTNLRALGLTVRPTGSTFAAANTLLSTIPNPRLLEQLAIENCADYDGWKRLNTDLFPRAELTFLRNGSVLKVYKVGSGNSAGNA